MSQISVCSFSDAAGQKVGDRNKADWTRTATTFAELNAIVNSCVGDVTAHLVFFDGDNRLPTWTEAAELLGYVPEAIVAPTHSAHRPG